MIHILGPITCQSNVDYIVNEHKNTYNDPASCQNVRYVLLVLPVCAGDRSLEVP